MSLLKAYASGNLFGPAFLPSRQRKNFGRMEAQQPQRQSCLTLIEKSRRRRKEALTGSRFSEGFEPRHLGSYGKPKNMRAFPPASPYLRPRIMADLKPFAALRPKPELAAQICELPYDVMSSAEARELASGNPLSFLHVSKPEIDLPAGTDLYAPEVYAKGRENFQKLIAEGALRQDAQPCFYVYRQVMGKHSQTGLVAAASCE